MGKGIDKILLIVEYSARVITLAMKISPKNEGNMLM
jgi:hypothetical protein